MLIPAGGAAGSPVTAASHTPRLLLRRRRRRRSQPPAAALHGLAGGLRAGAASASFPSFPQQAGLLRLWGRDGRFWRACRRACRAAAASRPAGRSTPASRVSRISSGCYLCLGRAQGLSAPGAAGRRLGVCRTKAATGIAAASLQNRQHGSLVCEYRTARLLQNIGHSTIGHRRFCSVAEEPLWRLLWSSPALPDLLATRLPASLRTRKHLQTPSQWKKLACRAQAAGAIPRGSRFLEAFSLNRCVQRDDELET